MYRNIGRGRVERDTIVRGRVVLYLRLTASCAMVRAPPIFEKHDCLPQIIDLEFKGVHFLLTLEMSVPQIASFNLISVCL